MVKMNCSQIIQEVKDKFRDIPYPEKDFYKAIAERDYLSVAESNKKKTWQDIDIDTLYQYYDFLLFLDKKGQKYYLPTYAIALLEDISLYDTWVYDTWLQVLNEVENNIFDKEQKKVIQKILKCIKDMCSDCEKDEIEILIKKFS